MGFRSPRNPDILNAAPNYLDKNIQRLIVNLTLKNCRPIFVILPSHLMQPKLLLNFDRLNEADLLAKIGSIIYALSNNPNFPEPWLPQLATLAQISAAYDTYLEAYHAALTGDSLKISLRNTARATVTDYIKKLAPYLEILAHGEATVLASSGFNLCNESTHTNDPLPAPSNVTVTHGLKKGCINIHANPLTGASSYELQTTHIDPSVETNWQHQLSSLTSSHIVIEGLTPRINYWIRLRGISRLGAGTWSEAIMTIID